MCVVGFSTSKLLDSEMARRLTAWLPNPPKQLLFRASEHEFLGEEFHKYCDGKGSIVMIVKGTHNETIFGGFSKAEWENPGGRTGGNLAVRNVN
jgi:hypothetical protein